MKAKTLAVSLCALFVVTAAHAGPVTYQFFADSSFPNESHNLPSITGSFTYTTSDFIRSVIDVPVSDLSACSVTASLGQTCSEMGFAPASDPSGYDSIGFGVDTPPFGGVGINYVFQAGALSAPGSYQTVLFDDWQHGRLVVTAVPEPETYGMLLAGLGMLGFMARRRKQNAA